MAIGLHALFICGVSQIRSPKSPNLLISISWLQDMTWKHDPKMTAKTNLWAATSWFYMGFPFWIKIIRNLGRSNPFHKSTTTKKKHLSMTPLKEKKIHHSTPRPFKVCLPPRKWCSQMLRFGKISRVNGINDGTGILAGREPIHLKGSRLPKSSCLPVS